MTEPAPIVAAGAVVVRKGSEVLLVHRPKYDDWSFPKGKLEPGEHPTAAAVREVAEETGLDVRLGPPLPAQEYLVRTGPPRPKLVHYWVARVVGDDDVSTYEPNAEIDDVAWVPLDRAADVLSYERDRALLTEARPLRKRTVPLVVLRHAKAVPRRDWDGDETKRPLTREGQEQAERLVPLLDAYGVRRAVSSSSRRCWTTLAPYADFAALSIEVTRALSEEKAAPGKVQRRVDRLLDSDEPAVVCTHRPVLPYLWEALEVRPTMLAAAAMLVVHHRRGSIVAVEHHSP